MNIIVLIKEVPDMDKVRFDTEKGLVDRSSAETEINPFDLYALQAAVCLKKDDSTYITALTMGPPKAERSARDAYARGADQGILLSDPAFGGADTWATAATLAAGIKKLGLFDLIICGEKSVDGDTAQVGAEVAEILEIPHSYYVEEIINRTKESITVMIEGICGGKQIREMKLPALISVTKNISAIDLPEVRRKLQSLKTDIKKLNYDDISERLLGEALGLKGSKTKVLRIHVPKEMKRENRLYRDNLKDFQQDLWLELSKRNILKNRGNSDERA